MDSNHLAYLLGTTRLAINKRTWNSFFETKTSMDEYNYSSFAKQLKPHPLGDSHNLPWIFKIWWMHFYILRYTFRCRFNYLIVVNNWNYICSVTQRSVDNTLSYNQWVNIKYCQGSCLKVNWHLIVPWLLRIAPTTSKLLYFIRRSIKGRIFVQIFAMKFEKTYVGL